MSYLNIIAIAAGGAFGALLRFYTAKLFELSYFISSSKFITPTLVVNALGCFCFALLISRLEGLNQESELNKFIFTGLLASFTTFSTFYYEIYNIYQKTNLLNSCLYLLSSLLVAALFFAIGLALSETLK